LKKDREVRVRIAPSPTGDPHVGTAYITLFNYVFAKKMGGKFVLRLEDTDQARAKPSSEKMIMDSLQWLGLEWDEGPDRGGPYAPYRQSERVTLHQNHAKILVDSGKAYHCFCTSERLEEVRAKQSGQFTGYDRHCRDMNPSEVSSKLKQGEASVIRLKMPIEGLVGFDDLLRGRIEIPAERLDDTVLLKRDGFPTYHLANVVDDYLMKISHVIRAEEWISSAPKHVTLYEAFGWEKPVFCHMPLLRNPDANKTKISKRKSPVSLNYFRRKGILPQALVNFLGLMGWSFGGDQDIFTVDQMIEKFDLTQIHLGGPVFDVAKLTWLNHQYLQKLSKSEYIDHLRNEVFSEKALAAIYPLLRERVECFEQFIDKGGFFFNGSLDYSSVELLPKGRSAPEIKMMLSGLLEKLDELYTWDAASIHETMDRHMAEIGFKAKDYFMPVRLAVSGRKDSPPLAESMEVIGREMVRHRLRDVLKQKVFEVV
jgi:glutamyl-tRNA synthetase